LPHKYN